MRRSKGRGKWKGGGGSKTHYVRSHIVPPTSTLSPLAGQQRESTKLLDIFEQEQER